MRNEKLGTQLAMHPVWQRRLQRDVTAECANRQHAVHQRLKWGGQVGLSPLLRVEPPCNSMSPHDWIYSVVLCPNNAKLVGWWMGMGFAPTWLRQVSPSPPALLHMTTLTTAVHNTRRMLICNFKYCRPHVYCCRLFFFPRLINAIIMSNVHRWTETLCSITFHLVH